MEKFSAPEPHKDIETKEKIPPFVVQIYFGSHGNAEDIQINTPEGSEDILNRKGLRELFQEADVYIPELSGWDETYLNQLQDLSYGRVTPSQMLAEELSHLKAGILDHQVRNSYDPYSADIMHGFRKAQLDMIYKSFKPIVVVDIPVDHPLTKKNIENAKEFDNMPENLTFEQALAWTKSSMRSYSDFKIEREDFMISQLTPQVEKALANRPDLRKKKKLKILMFLGASHGRVAQQLSGYGVKTESKHSRLPNVRSYQDEALKRLENGKEINNELAAKILGQNMLLLLMWNLLSRATPDSSEKVMYIRKVGSLFSVEEIKNIFSIKNPTSKILAISVVLRQKGIKVPQNRAELLKFISDNMMEK